MHRILIDLGGFAIPSYGVLLVIGFVTASFLLKRESDRLGRDGQKMVDLAVVALLIGLLGAKLLLIAIDLPYYLQNPRELLGTLRAAGVLYGGMVAGLAGAIWYIKKHRMPVWDTVDIMAPFTALAIGFGRIGCFAAGCCHGIAYDGPLHVVFPADCDAPAGVPLFPIQLLASLNGFVLSMALLWLLRHRKFKGQVVLMFLILYSTTRGLMEFLRGDDVRGIWGGASTSQIIALAVLIVSIWFYFKRRKTL